jgi:hypothetical protein
MCKIRIRIGAKPRRKRTFERSIFRLGANIKVDLGNRMQRCGKKHNEGQDNFPVAVVSEHSYDDLNS